MTINRTRRRGGPRISFRVILALLIAVVVGGAILYVTTRTTASYRVVVAAREFVAGSVFPGPEAQAYVVQEAQGQPPGVPGMVLSDANINPGDPTSSFIGRVFANTVYPGMVIQQGDFYAPRQDGSAFDPNKVTFASRLSDLLTGDQRAFVISGDPTSTFVRRGDVIDVYFIPSGSAVVKWLYAKQVIYAVDQAYPNAGEAVNLSGTTFVIDMNTQEIQDLLWAMQNGTIRIAIANVTQARRPIYNQTTAQFFSDTYKVDVAGVTVPYQQTPAPTPTPEPSSEVSPSPAAAP